MLFPKTFAKQTVLDAQQRWHHDRKKTGLPNGFTQSLHPSWLTKTCCSQALTSGFSPRHNCTMSSPIRSFQQHSQGNAAPKATNCQSPIAMTKKLESLLDLQKAPVSESCRCHQMNACGFVAMNERTGGACIRIEIEKH